ncbi:MAG: HYR domain-containing protein, partial [Saprospiraceae bacterium]
GFGRFVSNNKFLYLNSRTNHRNNLGNSDGFLTISQANFENCIDNNITLNITPMVDTFTEFAPTVSDEMIPIATNESSNNISYNDADICQLPCSVSFSYSAGECGELDFSSQTNLTGDLTYNWTFGTNPQTSSTQQNPSHTYLSNGTFNVCVTVTSGATSCNVCQNVIVNNADVIAPVINCPNNIQLSNSTGQFYANITPQISVTDNCDPNPTCNCIMTGATSGVMPKNANVQFNVGVTTVTCRATDASGRVSQPCTFTVTVFDSEPPKINCPPGITIGCNIDFENLSITGTATATDNCPGVMIGHTDSFGGSVCNRTVTRTWKATDVSGAITTCVQVIKIEDKQAPVITCPPNLTLSCGANTNPSQTGSATATDACQNEIIITHLDVISGDECDKTITRTWSANDGCTNISTCIQTIRLIDQTPPTFICGSNITPIECTQNTSGFGISNVMDNCGGKIDQTKVDMVIVNGCITTINRTWTVTDKCGNSATCSQVITMQDTKPPVLSGCGRKLTMQGVSIANGICNAPVSLSAPSVTDMCDGTVTLTNSYNNTANASGTYPTGQTIITWTAKDDCGLMAMCRDTVVVLGCDTSNNNCICPINPTFTLKEGNKNPVTVSCNQSPTTIPVLDCPVEPISISGNFGCVSSNPNMPCPANAISWTLDRPVLPDLTGNVSGPNFGVSFIASTIDVPGTYALNLLTVCNGDTCTCVIKWVQRECADCKCPDNPTFSLKEGNKNPVIVSCNQSPTTIPVLDCPVETISLAGSFGCVATSPNMECPANVISWTLDRPTLPDLTGNVNGPNFGVSFIASNIDAPGTYSLNLLTVCNGDTCRCVIKWVQRECADCICPANPTFTLKEGNKNPVTVSCNQSPAAIPVLDCPVEPVSISGNFGCVASDPNKPCEANAIKWTLDRPTLPDLTGNASGPIFG